MHAKLGGESSAVLPGKHYTPAPVGGQLIDCVTRLPQHEIVVSVLQRTANPHLNGHIFSLAGQELA